MRLRLVVLSVITMALLSSCGRQPIEQFHNVADRTWLFNKPENFEVNIPSPGTYSMLVQVRYTQEYSFSNIWVELNEKSPDGKKDSMRLNIPLFDLSGSPVGSFAGKFYDRSFPDAQIEGKELKLNFPSAGKYIFSLEHNMRIDKLDGISQLGIRLKQIG